MGKALLLIEDDLILVNMYQRLLLNHGYNVHTAINGVDGLKKALQDHPDLILLDIRMPKMDGLTMLRYLRKDEWGKSAKVIILTNLEASDQILKEIVVEQPTYYLVKSNTSPEKVLERIKEVVGEQNNLKTE